MITFALTMKMDINGDDQMAVQIEALVSDLLYDSSDAYELFWWRFSCFD